MGVIKHRDVLTSKFVTALISNSSDRLFFVPIKKTLGDYFVTELDGNVYAFTLKNARILNYREFLAKTAKAVIYDTTHYRSVHAGNQKELELVLEKNQLPKMNRVQLAALQILGRKEVIVNQKDGTTKIVKRADVEKQRNAIKDKFNLKISKDELRFTPHEISELITDLQEKSNKYQDEADSMINYLESLDIEQIVTPVRKLTENLHEDLIATSPSFLGEALPRYTRLDNEHKGVANKPVSSKLPLFKWAFIITLGIALIGLIAHGINEGWFDSITSMFPNPETFKGISNVMTNPQAVTNPSAVNQCSDEALQARYTPLELKIAVENGNETCKLSPTMQKLVDGVELPKVSESP